MIQEPITQTRRVVLGVLSMIVLIGSYGFFSHKVHVENPDDTTIPTWSQMGEGVKMAITPDKIGNLKFKRMLAEGETFNKAQEVWVKFRLSWLYQDTIATMGRLLAGMGVGIILAFVFGVLMGSYPSFEAFFSVNWMLFSRMVPTAMLAIFFNLVGTGTAMYITMIAFGIVPNLALSICLEAKAIPSELKYKTYTLGATSSEAIWDLVVKQILPRMMELFRLAIGPALVYLIAAELICGDVGMGYRIRNLSRRLDMSVVYPYILILAGYGFLLERALLGIQKKLCPWYNLKEKL